MMPSESGRLSPQDYRHVKCERCGAGVGDKCVSRNGVELNYAHVGRVLDAPDRWELALDEVKDDFIDFCDERRRSRR